MRLRRIHTNQADIQHIGNPNGKIAIWCDESEAWDLASQYPYPDKFGMEIGEAILRAYPTNEDVPDE